MPSTMNNATPALTDLDLEVVAGGKAALAQAALAPEIANLGSQMGATVGASVGQSLGS